MASSSAVWWDCHTTLHISLPLHRGCFFFLLFGHHGWGWQPLSLLMNVQNVTVKKGLVCLYFSPSRAPACAFVRVPASAAEERSFREAHLSSTPTQKEGTKTKHQVSRLWSCSNEKIEFVGLQAFVHDCSVRKGNTWFAFRKRSTWSCSDRLCLAETDRRVFAL